MDGFLKQSTASQTRWIGPFVDDTDFKTAETGLTIANTDIKISANGGASASKNSGGGTHDTNGMYAVTWDATDTATVGELKYSVKVAGALQVFGSYVVLEEAVYDALFAASAPGYVANAPVNVAQFGGSNGTFSGGRPEVNTTHAAGTAWGSGAITAASIAADAITAAKIADGAIDAGALAADAITAAKIAADAVTEIQSGLATQASVDTIDNFLDTEIAAILAAVDTEVAAILALLDDARTEPGQGAPPVNPDLATKIDWLYAAWRNKKTNDGSTTNLFADDGSTVISKQSTSESGGTVTKAEWITGA